MFGYVSHRIPEISDEIYKIDAAMCAGFGWEIGPFEIWDSLGISEGVKLIKDAELDTPNWIDDLNTKNSFYDIEDGYKTYFNIKELKQKKIPVLNKFIILNNLRDTVIWENEGVSIFPKQNLRNSHIHERRHNIPVKNLII